MGNKLENKLSMGVHGEFMQALFLGKIKQRTLKRLYFYGLFKGLHFQSSISCQAKIKPKNRRAVLHSTVMSTGGLAIRDIKSQPPVKIKFPEPALSPFTIRQATGRFLQ